MIKKISFLFSILLAITVFSQTLVSRLEKKTLALGEPNELTIQIDPLLSKPVSSAPKNELLPFHFEIIDDKISKTKDHYERKIKFALFQEGSFEIPSLEFNIDGKIEKTTPYLIQVVNTAKKEDKISDIMKNKIVALDLQDYWQLYKLWLLAAIAIIGTCILIFAFFKNRKKIQYSPQFFSNKTLHDLEILKQKKYIETGNFRAFYVELIDLMRVFLSEQYHIPATVLLTDDLVAYMKQNHGISTENESKIEEVFLRGDLVKFAKIFPTTTMMDKDWNDCFQVVKASVKDIEFENLRKDV